MTCIVPLNYATESPKRIITPLRITYAGGVLAGGSTLFFGMGAALFIMPAAIVIGVAAVSSARRLGILHALGANISAAMALALSVFLNLLHDERTVSRAYSDAAYMGMAMIGMFGVLGLFGGGVTIGIRWIVRKLIARARTKATVKVATTV